jgi:hypothetical protein
MFISLNSLAHSLTSVAQSTRSHRQKKKKKKKRLRYFPSLDDCGVGTSSLSLAHQKRPKTQSVGKKKVTIWVHDENKKRVGAALLWFVILRRKKM